MNSALIENFYYKEEANFKVSVQERYKTARKINKKLLTNIKFNCWSSIRICLYIKPYILDNTFFTVFG